MNRKIELKATGETITFMGSDLDPDSQLIQTIVTLPGSGEGPPMHRHILQTEHFEAIEGKLGLDCEDEKIVLEPGQSYTVPADALHRCYAIEASDIRFSATFKPALNIEYILSEIFASCNRKNAKMPSPFDACYILQEVKDEYALGNVPMMVQNTAFPLIAWVGKTLGFVKAQSKSQWQANRME